MQSTYTTISFLAYKNRYCAYYQGDTCAEALATLFSVEPTTGQRRVDLLGVSSLMLISQDFPQQRLDHPPMGWRVEARTPNTTLWARTHPLAGSGWRSRGPRRAPRVSDVSITDTRTSFRVDDVPADGGTVVLSLLDWPGYATDVGSLADPVDGYLVTVHLPASAAGETVHVGLPPAGLDRRDRRVGAGADRWSSVVAAPRRTPSPGRVDLGRDSPEGVPVAWWQRATLPRCPKSPRRPPRTPVGP